MFVAPRRYRLMPALHAAVVIAVTLIAPATALADVTPDTSAVYHFRTSEITGPTVSTPVVRFQSNAPVTDTVPVRVGWTGSDPAGIDHYTVHVSVDGASYHTLKSSLHATSYLTRMRPGHSYRYRARGVDKLGNVGAWKYSVLQRLKIVDDTDPTTQYVGNWHHRSSPILLGGHARYSFEADATVQVTFGGHAIAWISRETVDGGKAVVLIDSHYVKTIDLNASPSRGPLIEFGRTLGSTGTHTIKVRVKGTGRVFHDAFLVLY